jgi:Sec-independent protein translocase protein TatA
MTIPVHLAIVVMVVLLPFGTKRVPEIGRSLWPPPYPHLRLA